MSAERTLGDDGDGANLVLRPYIRNYVDTFIGKSITTEQWKDHLYGYFKDQKDKLDTIKWDVSFACVVQEMDITCISRRNGFTEKELHCQ